MTDWDPALYDAKHSWVWKRGEGVVELLAPQKGETILDLGCGTAHLTARIAKSGARVIGIDASESMISSGRREFPDLDLRVGDGRAFQLEAPADAVFSNAALHWMQPPEAVVACVARALKPGGRFVAEMGGKGNLSMLLEGLRSAVASAGLVAPPVSHHLFFPNIAEYGAILEAHGLELRNAMLFERPTPLEGGREGLRNWVRQFGMHIFEVVPREQQERVLRDVEARLRPALWDGRQWVADYRRLRFVAIRR